MGGFDWRLRSFSRPGIQIEISASTPQMKGYPKELCVCVSQNRHPLGKRRKTGPLKASQHAFLGREFLKMSGTYLKGNQREPPVSAEQELEKAKNKKMFPELFQHKLCTNELLNHVCFGFLEVLFLLCCSKCVFFPSGFLKMFPLYLLDQVQLTWLTHGKTGSLKMLKKRTTRVPFTSELGDFLFAMTGSYHL